MQVGVGNSTNSSSRSVGQRIKDACEFYIFFRRSHLLHYEIKSNKETKEGKE
jgi:hypothetical protein